MLKTLHETRWFSIRHAARCCSTAAPCTFVKRPPSSFHLLKKKKKTQGNPLTTGFMTHSTHLLYCSVGGLANPNNNLNSVLLLLSAKGFHRKPDRKTVMSNFLHFTFHKKGGGGKNTISEEVLITKTFALILVHPPVQLEISITIEKESLSILGSEGVDSYIIPKKKKRKKKATIMITLRRACS